MAPVVHHISVSLLIHLFREGHYIIRKIVNEHLKLMIIPLMPPHQIRFTPPKSLQNECVSVHTDSGDTTCLFSVIIHRQRLQSCFESSVSSFCITKQLFFTIPAFIIRVFANDSWVHSRFHLGRILTSATGAISI